MQFVLRRLPEYTDQALLDEVRRVAKIMGVAKLSQQAFGEHSRVHPTTVRRRFGTWRRALERAGLADLYDSSSNPLTKDQVISELRRVARILGSDTFDREQFKKHAQFSDAPVRRLYGTWHRAMRAAGLRTGTLGKRYTDEECFENLLTVWTHYGRAPKHREMNLPPSVVGPKAYVRRFGTWVKALHAFVSRVESGVEDEREGPREIPPDTPGPPPTLASLADGRKVSLSLRYRVLARDRFRCVLCGRNPASDPGVTLHVDHIIPVAHGGQATLQNLRVLCSECNLGKGDKTGVEPGDTALGPTKWP